MNLGGYDANAFNEKEGNRILEGILLSQSTIFTHFAEQDKTPNVDGFFELLKRNGNKSVPFATFKVQIKTYSDAPDENGVYHYSCDTKILNYAQNLISFDPLVVFLVVIEAKKVYYKYLSQQYVRKLNVGEQKDKVILFCTEDELTDVADFFQKMKS